jgi:protein TonB
MWHRPPVSTGYSILKDRRVRNAGIVASILVAHLGVAVLIGRGAPAGPLVVPPPPIEVLLVRPEIPPPPPPPPPPEQPVRSQGGGAPAAPSRVHLSPRPPEVPPELSAPVTPAPEPALTVGVAPIASAEPGMGQGGQGTGQGTGVGPGNGPGSGIGPIILRGASAREIFEDTPRELRRRARGVDVTVSCEIRLDERVEGCRVVDERPAGQGFGAVAVRIAEGRFRIRPARSGSGQAVAGGRITIGVIWP